MFSHSPPPPLLRGKTKFSQDTALPLRATLPQSLRPRRHDKLFTFEPRTRSTEETKLKKKPTFWNQHFLLLLSLASTAKNQRQKTPKFAYAVLERLSPRNHANFRPPFEISEDVMLCAGQRGAEMVPRGVLLSGALKVGVQLIVNTLLLYSSLILSFLIK